MLLIAGGYILQGGTWRGGLAAGRSATRVTCEHSSIEFGVRRPLPSGANTRPPPVVVCLLKPRRRRAVVASSSGGDFFGMEQAGLREGSEELWD